MAHCSLRTAAHLSDVRISGVNITQYAISCFQSGIVSELRSPEIVLVRDNFSAPEHTEPSVDSVRSEVNSVWLELCCSMYFVLQNLRSDLDARGEFSLSGLVCRRPEV
jgi:hypothetical protein